MKAVGIIAEYNPFHRGHAYQIGETRRLLGEDTPVICVMSGHWVQRGECALTDKWTRAKMALCGGVDLVLELPTPWATSSAEGFARGAVAILKGTGLVDRLSFGSESGDADGLLALSEASETDAYRESLRRFLDQGLSFASARQKALAQCSGRKAELLGGPNDSLAIEYLRAAAGTMSAVAVLRRGAAHDSGTASGGYASASEIRKLLGKAEPADAFLPESSCQLLESAALADYSRVERAVLARLRVMNEADFALLPDSGMAEGLPARLVRGAKRATSLEEFYQIVKCKRYAHSRLRRVVLHAFLGINAMERTALPPYLRVLGMNGRGRELLREMKMTASLPIVTKPTHSRHLPESSASIFELESRCTDLFSLCLETPRPCGAEYINGPVIL